MSLHALKPLVIAAAISVLCACATSRPQVTVSSIPPIGTVSLLSELAELQGLVARKPVDIAFDKLSDLRVRLQAGVQPSSLKDERDWQTVSGAIDTLLAQRQLLREVANASDAILADDDVNMEAIELLTQVYQRQPGHAKEMHAVLLQGTLTQRLMKNIGRLRVSLTPETVFLVGKDTKSLQHTSETLLKGGQGFKPAKGEARVGLEKLQILQTEMSGHVSAILNRLQPMMAAEEARNELLSANARLMRSSVARPVRP